MPGKPGPHKQDLGLPLGRQLNPPFKHRHEEAVWMLAEPSLKFSYTFQPQAGKAAHQLSREGKQRALSVIYWGTAQPCSTPLICTQSNSSAVRKSSDNPPLATGLTHMKTQSTLGPWADAHCWGLEKKSGAASSGCNQLKILSLSLTEKRFSTIIRTFSFGKRVCPSSG